MTIAGVKAKIKKVNSNEREERERERARPRGQKGGRRDCHIVSLTPQTYLSLSLSLSLALSLSFSLSRVGPPSDTAGQTALPRHGAARAPAARHDPRETLCKYEASANLYFYYLVLASYLCLLFGYRLISNSII